MNTIAQQFPNALLGHDSPLVSFKDVSKSYGDLTVVDGFNLDVHKGETVSIIGPSGSGKTTVLRLLMTLESVDQGVIYVNREPLTHMEKNGVLVPANAKHLRRMRSHIGMCFQHFNLFPHMTALENCMEGPIQVLGLSHLEARNRAKELLHMVGLADKCEQHPATLSGGQKQRVAIARALAMRPEIMLFDEITSSLDPEVIGEVTSVIKQLVEAHNLTIIMVTHQMGFAREISDRVCFLYGGKVEEEGTPEEIFNHPAKPRTRQFLSAINKAL